MAVQGDTTLNTQAPEKHEVPKSFTIGARAKLSPALDVLLETAYEVAGHDAPTEYLEGEPSDRTVCDVQQPKTKSRRGLRFFLFVLLVGACAGAYPFYREDLAPYVEKLRQMWITIEPHIDIYIQKLKELLPN